MAKKKRSLSKRRTTKKKTTTRRTKKRTTTKKPNVHHEALEQLAVMYNPFLRTTEQPKIPDGKVNVSFGQKYTVTEEYINTGQPTMHMFLIPGQSGGLYVANCQDFGTGVIGNVGTPNYNGAGGFNITNYDDPGKRTTTTAREPYHSWRIVSQGLKLSLLNNAEENDGWWEAIRFHPVHDFTDFSLYPHNNDVAKGYMPFNLNAFTQQQGRSNLSDDKTYIAGTLRELHHHQFNLHPIQDECDFQRVFTPVDFNDTRRNADLVTYKCGEGTLDANTYRPGQFDAIDSYVYKGFDMIYIRLHCRPATPTPSRILAQLACNQEIIFDTDANEHKYQSKTHSVGNIESLNKARNAGGEKASVTKVSSKAKSKRHPR